VDLLDRVVDGYLCESFLDGCDRDGDGVGGGGDHAVGDAAGAGDGDAEAEAGEDERIVGLGDVVGAVVVGDGREGAA
jgi:hypothetical protein